MDLSPHLRNLLYQNSCVILPGFGGFITNYSSATIDEEALLSPPRMSLAFNRKLTSNDGLLVNHLCRSQKLNSKDALSVVEDYVHSLQLKLLADQPLQIEGIGRFIPEKENTIRFIPDGDINFYVDSFGMRNFKFLPLDELQKSSTQPLPVEQIHEEVTEDATASNPVPKKKNLKYWGVAATVLALIAVGQFLFFPLQPQVIFFDNVDFSRFLNRNIMVEPSAEQENVVLLSEDVYGEEDAIPEVYTREEEEIVADIAPSPLPAPAVTSTENDASAAQPGYYAIYGSFKEQRFAEKMRVELEKNHSSTFIFETKANGFKKVGYFLAADKQTALEQIKAIQEEAPGTWLFRHR